MMLLGIDWRTDSLIGASGILAVLSQASMTHQQAQKPMRGLRPDWLLLLP